MEQIAEGSPRPNARTIGVVYLSYFLMAFLGGFLAKGLVVPGDAAATANSISAHEALYRSGFAVGLIANLIYIAVTALFYRLFEPVNRTLSLLAAFFSLVGCTIQILAGLLQLAPLVVLGDSQLLNALTVEQLQMAALLCLKLYSQAFSISLVLFALYDLLVGYLIFTSTFLPRIIGVFMMCAGVGWLTFVWPPLAATLSSYVLPFGALAELLLMLWLLVKGVDTSRWREKVGTGNVART
ncbi:MAG: DUF4386 domain-containing protein [Rhodanobacteraceae bacterium]